MPKKKSLALSIKLEYKKYLPVLAAAITLIFLYTYKLGNLVGGLSASEVANNVPKISFTKLLEDPLFLPIKIFKLVLASIISKPTIYEVRIVSALFGVLAIIFVYKIIYSWLGKRTAILTALLMAFSAWNLHMSRLADYFVAFIFGSSLLVLCSILLKKHLNDKRYFYFITAVIWPLLIYIPGLIYLLVFTVIKQKADLKEGFNKHFNKTGLIIYVSSAIVFIPLLANYLVRSPSNILKFLALPENLHSLINYPLNILKTIYHVFLFGPHNPEMWLGRLPILDFLMLATTLIGIYFYVTHYNDSRSKLILGLFVISILVSASINPNNISLIYPILFCFIATGIALILQRYLKVFPKNPIARGFGIGLILVLVGVSCIFNYRSYFIAWPHNIDTKNTFIYK